MTGHAHLSDVVPAPADAAAGNGRAAGAVATQLVFPTRTSPYPHCRRKRFRIPRSTAPPTPLATWLEPWACRRLCRSCCWSRCPKRNHSRCWISSFRRQTPPVVPCPSATTSARQRPNPAVTPKATWYRLCQGCLAFGPRLLRRLTFWPARPCSWSRVHTSACVFSSTFGRVKPPGNLCTPNHVQFFVRLPSSSSAPSLASDFLVLSTPSAPSQPS
mmetsp:Transcript_66253/g.184498  ORF Transcript_66253/g.184498 Transcript_66253/m.184498 type:complete len:216 (-) Transcript_66253:1330-1977(-)